MLRTDSKKKALAVLQSKLHGERKRQLRPGLSDYEPSLSEINERVKTDFNILEKKLQPIKKIKKVITKGRRSKESTARKVRLGLFARMISKMKKDLPKVKNIGTPKFKGISSK